MAQHAPYCRAHASYHGTRLISRHLVLLPVPRCWRHCTVQARPHSKHDGFHCARGSTASAAVHITLVVCTSRTIVPSVCHALAAFSTADASGLALKRDMSYRYLDGSPRGIEEDEEDPHGWRGCPCTPRSTDSDDDRNAKSPAEAWRLSFHRMKCQMDQTLNEALDARKIDRTNVCLHLLEHMCTSCSDIDRG